MTLALIRRIDARLAAIERRIGVDAPAASAARDEARELLEDALNHQRIDAPGWRSWWHAWHMRAVQCLLGEARR